MRFNIILTYTKSTDKLWTMKQQPEKFTHPEIRCMESKTWYYCALRMIVINEEERFEGISKFIETLMPMRYLNFFYNIFSKSS